MKKTRKNAGFTLIELICTILILVLLIMGINVGMDAGSRIYRDATFEADSATLAGILNTTISDVLRYSMVTETEGMRNLPEGINSYELPYVYTNLEYGVQRAYFTIQTYPDGTSALKMINLKDSRSVDLVNLGAYPELAVSDFVISYIPRRSSGVEGGYFEVSYNIHSAIDSSKTREVEMIVRQMNG